MTRQDRNNIKHYIKSICVDSIKELANNVGLTEFETKLLIYINRGESRVWISLKLDISESKVTKDLRKIFTRIYDYLKRQE